LQAKIERNLEYRKRAYEQFMDEVLSKEEYLELKQMYETENQKYQKELSELNHEEQRQRAAVNETIFICFNCWLIANTTSSSSFSNVI